MTRGIDLNCDMGESFGAWSMGEDAAVMPWISSASIACGFHAGDPMVMRATLGLAREHGVAVGAHVSLPDLQGFGRREMRVTPEEAYAFTLYQTGALTALAQAQGMRLRHMKPHGALYNMAARDAALARAIASAVRDADPALVLFGLSGGALVAAGRELGLSVCNEVFADRSYEGDGTLTPRKLAGAVLDSQEQALEQALALALRGAVRTRDGGEIALGAETICVHGDRPGAAALARAMHEALAAAGVAVRSPGSTA